MLSEDESSRGMVMGLTRLSSCVIWFTLKWDSLRPVNASHKNECCYLVILVSSENNLFVEVACPQIYASTFSRWSVDMLTFRLSVILHSWRSESWRCDVCDVAPPNNFPSILHDILHSFFFWIFGENKRFIMFISSRDVMYFFFIMERHKTWQTERDEDDGTRVEDERAETEKVLSLIENW